MADNAQEVQPTHEEMVTTSHDGEEDDQHEPYEEEHADIFGEYQPTEQLDSHLAVIEEQFRKSFEDRLASASSQRGKPQFWEDETEILRSTKIFRAVSRSVGDDWKPIFKGLMVKFPAEVTDAETAKIEMQQPIIRCYKALTAWKELSGPNYTIMKLVDVLRENNMDDVADETLNILDGTDTNDEKSKSEDKSKSDKVEKPVQRKKSETKSIPGILTNRHLLLLAKKVGSEWEPLGKALNTPDEELAEIRGSDDATTYQGAFKVLWAWRQTQPPIEAESSRTILKEALQKVGKKDLADELGVKTTA